jgi:hypothetical protein
MKKIFLLLIFLPALCKAQIPADSARYYYDQQKEICGNVLDANSAIRSMNGDSTYLVEFELGTRIENKKSLACTVFVLCKAGEYNTSDLRKKYTNAAICVKGRILHGHKDATREIPRIQVKSMDDVQLK